MPFATASDGTRLFYDTVGEATSSPPLLLIAGQAFDHHMWDLVRDDFSAPCQVIVYDHRGIGQSDKPQDAQGYSTRAFAHDALAVLDAVGARQAHVYGFSMGGRIAQWLGIEHGPRVRTLVLGATTPGNAHGVRRSPETDAILLSGNAQALQETLVSPAWRSQHPEWVAMMAHRAQHPMPGYAQRLHFVASEGHDAWADLPRIKAPTLLVHGSDDRINVPANTPLMAQRIPGARQVLIDGARHGYFWEYREQASALVLAFLREFSGFSDA